MFKCNNCKHLFESGEEKRWEEQHPYGNTTASEQFSGCPICGEEYDEINSCEICGTFSNDKYDYAGICYECFSNGINKYFDEYIEMEDLETEFYIGNVAIDNNGVYDINQIVVILKKEYSFFSEYFPNVVYGERKEFINSIDPYHFAEWLIEKMKKN